MQNAKTETHYMPLIDKLLHKLNKNMSRIDNVAKESRNLVNKTTLTLNSGKMAHAAMYSGLLKQLMSTHEGTSSPRGNGYPQVDLSRSTLKVPNIGSSTN